ncbi:F5/8 type C domain-containing protein [Micromonospora pisi]|uniref:F5/8 type C domain-containing protein n=1 Tax=Micromonospora pisi TaxID=589240 RepID=A0A495JGW4_9ACTN|nr:discoidin domain-containing protein [Micromonospora pisi]RKR87582.1 F5/8 type C domain-containing protein [Micromonospora pisi]
MTRTLWRRLAGLSRGRKAAVAGAVVALVAIGGTAPAVAGRPEPARLSLGSDVSLVQVNPIPCANQGFQLQFGNTGRSEVYADAFLEVPAPLKLSRNLVSSYLPAGYTLKVPIAVTAPRDTAPGRYAVTVRSGQQRLTVPVEVAPAPVEETGNLARYVPVSASSENLPTYPACGAVDGDRDSTHWASTTGWNDSTKGSFPDWLQVTFDRPQSVGRVDLYTLDSAKYPAARYGLRDWDVQVRVNDTWQTVAQVRGNVAGLVSSTFPAVTATAMRIVTLVSNETAGYSRVIELEAYAS